MNVRAMVRFLNLLDNGSHYYKMNSAVPQQGPLQIKQILCQLPYFCHMVVSFAHQSSMFFITAYLVWSHNHSLINGVIQQTNATG